MQQNERLSAYMDGEETGFAEDLLNSSDLQKKWANYHTIRNVMQGEEVILGADFSAKMAALIEEETIEAKPKGLLLKLKRWSTPLMQAGIAASVCLVAVLGVNYMNSQEEVAHTPTLITNPFSSDMQAVSYNAPAKDLATPERLAQQEQRVQMIMNNQTLQQQQNAANGVTLSDAEKAKAQTSATQPAQQLQK